MAVKVEETIFVSRWEVNDTPTPRRDAYASSNFRLALLMKATAMHFGFTICVCVELTLDSGVYVIFSTTIMLIVMITLVMVCVGVFLVRA